MAVKPKPFTFIFLEQYHKAHYKAVFAASPIGHENPWLLQGFFTDKVLHNGGKS